MQKAGQAGRLAGKKKGGSKDGMREGKERVRGRKEREAKTFSSPGKCVGSAGCSNEPGSVTTTVRSSAFSNHLRRQRLPGATGIEPRR